MKSLPDFSFIIPARNEGRALQETLSHIPLLAEESRIETILVDDCSDPPILESHNVPSSVIYHRCQSRQGVARARNFGATLASGSILFFIDAHVCFSTSILRELLVSGVAEGGGIRGCATHLVQDFDSFVELARHSPREHNQHFDKYYGWQLQLQPLPDVVVNRIQKQNSPFVVPYVGACALAVRRSLFFELGGYDEGLVGFGSLEDAELAMRCWSFGKDVQMIPTSICHHFSEPRSFPSDETSNQRSPLDHPRYDGSFHNALRIMYLHFPDTLFADILPNLNQVSQEKGCPPIGDQFVSDELRARRDWLDSHRKYDREWLIKRMTEV